MRRSLLALLALLPATYATTSATPSGVADAAPQARSAPRGEAVYRPDCFSNVLTKEFLSRVPAGRSYQSAVTTTPGTTAQPSAPPPVEAAPQVEYEVAQEERSASAISLGKNKGGKKSKPSKSPKAGASNAAAPAPEPPPPPAIYEEQRQVAEDAEASRYAPDDDAAGADMVLDDPYDGGVAAGLLGGGSYDQGEDATEADGRGDAALRSKDDRAKSRTEEKAQRGPVLDWGAEIFLSNDDSMSLASAQRVLYSVMNHMGMSPQEIRPHELLNYFSFDTVTPDADQLFDVLASAERDGDTLSLALAVKGGTPPRSPLDLTVVVDRSCSMEDEGRMDYTKRALTQMGGQLEDGDRVDIVLFDDTICVPLENWVEGRDDPELLERTIAMMQPEGGTDLDIGLREAYRVAQSHLDTRGRNRRVMVMTDALLNTGDVNHDTVSEIGRSFDDEQIRLTGVGVGRDFNDEVLDMLTEKGKGAYVYLGSEAVVDRLFGPDGFRSLTETIAHDVQFSLQLPDSLAMERFYGEEASTVAADIQPVNYYTGTSQLFLQDLVIKDGDPRRGDQVVLTVSYRDALTGEPAKRTFKTTVGVMLDADPHNVRKGLALMSWTDMLMADAMGADPCGRELDAYAERAGKLSDDAEIGFINGLIERECGRFELPSYVSSVESVLYKVRVDSDIPIAEVQLACGRHSWSEALTGSDTVARFDAVPGECEVTLAGQIPMTARVDVPVTGGDLRCIVRGGRLSCS